MLIVHHLLDALRTRPKLYGAATRERLAAVVEAIAEAEKFDFGLLPLEPEGESGHYALPALTPAEVEAWREGLVPLPSPTCWYEYTLGRSRSGLLTVLMDDGRWAIMRFDWDGSDPIYDEVWTSINPTTDLQGADRFLITLSGNGEFRKRFTPAQVQSFYGNNVPLVAYLTLMLGSPSTEVRSEPAPERLNRARRAKRLTPLAAHRVVRIVPEAYLRAARQAQGLSGRLPPRLHWRRSHVRTLRRGAECGAAHPNRAPAYRQAGDRVRDTRVQGGEVGCTN